MNLLAKAKLSPHVILSSPSPGMRLFNLLPKTTALLQCELYSTKTTNRGSSQKAQKSVKPKPQKPTPVPSTTFSHRVRKQTEALTAVWPKPGEIRYQAKIANFVNLIGRVELPIRFESTVDGKHLATTVVSLMNEGVRTPPAIPVLFEGILAHVVSCHVRENDYIFVSGQLSLDPMSLVPSKSLGKFHVVAENINFVEGFKKNSSSGLETDRFGKNEAEVFDKFSDEADTNINFVEGFKKNSSSGLETDRSGKNEAEVFDELSDRADTENDKPLTQKANSESGNDGGLSLLKLDRKKKDVDKSMDLWRDLIKNPLQWWDFREHKTNGLVKENHPDFKQKVTNESLWIKNAPIWILPGIGKLEFDVKDLKPKQNPTDDYWKDLIENPDNWWDNRTRKKNPKAPDFKHRETGQVLWLNQWLPSWVSSKLPPLKD